MFNKQNTIKKIIKQKRGITLIALVITTIVLLILAGITVASLTGENGLLGKSGEAKKQTEISEGLEQLEIAVTQSTNKRGNIDTTRLAKNLSKINGLKYINTENQEIDVAENTDIKLTAKVKIKGITFKINDEGNVSYKKDGAIDNEDIFKSPETYYGHYVTNYNSPNDAGIVDKENQLGKWKIFMSDEENIYLIASNCINRYYTGTKNNVGFYDRSIEDTEIVSSIGFSTIENQYSKNDIPLILSQFSDRTRNNYFKWLNNPANQNKNYRNVRSVLAMMDKTLWEGFKNDIYANYAIGGPSLEMFCYSYNCTHVNNKIIAKDNYNLGYEIQKNNDEDNESITGLSNNLYVDEMYFKNRYWLASPSNRESHYIHAVFNAYSVGGNRDYMGIQFLPLACLKSDVHLIKNADGETYSLELD